MPGATRARNFERRAAHIGRYRQSLKRRRFLRRGRVRGSRNGQRGPVIDLRIARTSGLDDHRRLRRCLSHRPEPTTALKGRVVQIVGGCSPQGHRTCTNSAFLSRCRSPQTDDCRRHREQVRLASTFAKSVGMVNTCRRRCESTWSFPLCCNMGVHTIVGR